MKLIIILAAAMLFTSQNQNYRSVYIFADKVTDVNVIQQLNILKSDPNGIKDRNIVFKVITTSSASGMVPYKNWHIPANTFTVILIGKDNGEKLRSHSTVSLSKLYDLIDSMPMRQYEVQSKHNP